MGRRQNLRRPSKHKIDIAALTEKLPGEITSIEPQKYHADRVSLFVEGDFLAGISVYTKEKIPVHTGEVLTAAKLISLLEWDQYPRLRQKMVDLLARRAHSRLELKQKAIMNGFKAELAEDVINSLEDSGYVDDAGFSLAYARDKFKFNKWGPNRIRAGLKSKGITDPHINAAIESISDSETQEQQITKLLEKQCAKFTKEADFLKRRKKAYNFLIRKGYRHSDVMKIIEQSDILI